MRVRILDIYFRASPRTLVVVLSVSFIFGDMNQIYVRLLVSDLRILNRVRK